MATLLRTGVRVVRGPDWPSPSSEDGGEGFVGTVVEVPPLDSAGGNAAAADRPSSSQLDSVTVQWDVGTRGSYRCGTEGKYDLRILDTAQAGSRHEGVACCACGQQGITGIRWSCQTCTDADLCSGCYGGNDHDTNHQFNVRPYSGEDCVDVGCSRASTRRLQSRGIYPGASVCFIDDSHEDASDESPDKPVAIVLRPSASEDGVVDMVVVEWSDKRQETCRLGQEGKVDIRCVEAADGGFYYPDHLPTLGAPSRIPSPVPVIEDDCTLAIGRIVQLPEMDLGLLRTLQDQAGGWDGNLTRVWYEVGEVKLIDESTGTVYVYYQSLKDSLGLHSAVVSLIRRFPVGSEVSLIRDKAMVRGMMKRCGELTPELEECFGAIGKIVERRADHNVQVMFNGKLFLVHPGCLAEASSYSAGDVYESSVCDSSDGAGKDSGPFTVCGDDNMIEKALSSGKAELGGVDMSTIMAMMTEAGLSPAALATSSSSAMTHFTDDFGDGPLKLIGRALLDHDIPTLRLLLQKHPDLVNERMGERNFTYMHVAAVGGNVTAAKLLKEHGCPVDVPDGVGGTPLHCAATETDSKMIACLLEMGADPNKYGFAGAGPLHVSCEAGDLESVRELVEHGADMMQMNGLGLRPLHDAVRRDHPAVVQYMIEAGADLRSLSGQDFNAAQTAAYHNSYQSLEVILRHEPSLVSEPKTRHGSHELIHIATCNNFVRCLEVILPLPQCDIEAKDNIGATALRTACASGCSGAVELLLAFGADINATDQDGSTPLHVSLYRHREAVFGCAAKEIVSLERSRRSHAPLVQAIQREMKFDSEQANRTAAIACFLAQQGANLYIMNCRGQTGLEFGCNDEIQRLILKYSAPAGSSSFLGSRKPCKTESPDTSTVPAQADSLASGEGDELSKATAMPSRLLTENEIAAKKHYAAKDVNSRYSSKFANDSCCVRKCPKKAAVMFKPCGHTVACEDCCFQYNLCSYCRAVVETRIKDGVELKPDPPVVVPVKTKVQVSIPRRRPRPVVKLACNFSTPRKPPPARTLDPAEENIALKGEAAARASLARTPRNRRKPSELPKQETEYNVF